MKNIKPYVNHKAYIIIKTNKKQFQMSTREGTIFSDIFDSYKTAVLHSIVTTFGLDFLVHDHFGGDVDTIRNVRPEDGRSAIYHKEANRMAYENRGAYDSAAYHNHDVYKDMIRDVRNKGFFDDAYSPGNRIAYGKQSALKGNPTIKANLDHMLSAKSIHDDPGRILAGKNGPDLANRESNLYFTNERLNKSLSDTDKLEYIQKRRESGNPLSPEEEAALISNHKYSKNEYERELNEYYRSSAFVTDTLLAAGKVGVQMGIRQVLGFIFMEIWFACEKEIKNLPPKTSFKDSFAAIRRGISIGIQNVQVNYKALLDQFAQGFIAGILASIATTLINIFVTTKVLQVRIIRHLFMSGVQTGNILLFNPRNELLGDQMKRASVAMITGASGVVGILIGSLFEKMVMPISPTLKRMVCTFISALVTALIACTILVFVDRSKLISAIIAKLNEYGSLAADLNRQIQEFDRIALEISQLDIEGFEDKINSFEEVSNSLINADEDTLNKILLEYFEREGISLPWEGDFDEFMSNKSNHLKFD